MTPSVFRVVLGGLLTTLLTLGAVWALEARGVTVMGWYLDGVIPIGALGVGVAASSGYGLASWLHGVKISGRLLAVMFAIQIGAYFAASGIQYAARASAYPDGSPVSFATYFDATTRAFALQSTDGSHSIPYGVWGYLFRALEIGGFSLGSLIGPGVLRGRAYCDSCSLYMRGARSAMFAASVPAVKTKKGDVQTAALHQAEQQAAYERAHAALDELQGLAESNDAPRFRDRLKEIEIAARASLKQPHRIGIAITRCPRCESGEMRATLWSGSGRALKQRELNRTALAQFFARDVAG